MLNGTMLNGAPLDGRAAQPSTGTTFLGALTAVVLLGTPAPVLAPIAITRSVPLPAPSGAAVGYVAPAPALIFSPLPIISAPPIPAPLAILGSTVFIDLADPLVFASPPIANAPPPVPPTPLKPQSGFVALAPMLRTLDGPLTITAASAHAPLPPSLQFIQLAPPASAAAALPSSSTPIVPPVPATLQLAIDKAIPGASVLVSGDTHAQRTLGVTSDAVTRTLETKE